MSLFAVKDKEGIIFTTITPSPEESIEEYLEIQAVCNYLANMGRESRGEEQKPAQEWLIEGEEVVEVEIVEKVRSFTKEEIDEADKKAAHWLTLFEE